MRPMMDAPMDAVLNNPRVPTLPMVAVEVLRLTREPDVNLKQLAEIVQNDQALAVKIVRTVNSSYYGLSVPCATINQAIIYLGLNAVKALVLGFSLVESVDGVVDDDVGFDYVDYWRRAMFSATAARELAALSEACDPEEAFLAALVQDLGMIALYRAHGDVYLQTIDLTQGDHSRLIEVEQRSIRMNHARIGAALAEKWRLPPQLVECIARHHGAEKASEEWRPLVRCVELATAFTSAAALGEVPQSIYRQASERLGLDAAALDGMLPKLGPVVAELSRLYRVDTGEPYDPERIMSEAEEIRIEHEVAMTRQLDEYASHASAAAAACGASDARQRSRDELLVKVGCAFEDAITSRTSFALLLIEIDEYAAVVQRHGAQAAHLLVQHVGGVLEEHAAGEVSSAGLARLADGRFGMVFPKADRRHAARKAESLRRRLEEECVMDEPKGEGDDGGGEQLRASISIGVAAVEPSLQAALDSAPSMLRIAEQALDAAIESGRNCVRVFSPNPQVKAAA